MRVSLNLKHKTVAHWKLIFCISILNKCLLNRIKALTIAVLSQISLMAVKLKGCKVVLGLLGQYNDSSSLSGFLKALDSAPYGNKC